uniref:Uncharacterized protein n=1 Tax=Meloidogyne hapla TaxID=6305 RepID=A0A1I8C2P2_MELHA
MSADSPDKKKFKESDVSIDKEVAELLAKLRKEESDKFNEFLARKDYTPENLLLDAKNHLKAIPADTRQAAEKVWLSFVCATKDIFAEIGVEFSSHRAVEFLSFFAMACNKKMNLRRTYDSANLAHKLHYDGASISEVDACIICVEDFINEYKSFDRPFIKKEFERFVIKDENKKEKTKFADEFLQNFVNKRDTLEIEEYERETKVFIGVNYYKNIKYKVY